eukprot:6190439-Pleurochrysis_carterae.AAC.5
MARAESMLDGRYAALCGLCACAVVDKLASAFVESPRGDACLMCYGQASAAAMHAAASTWPEARMQAWRTRHFGGMLCGALSYGDVALSSVRRRTAAKRASCGGMAPRAPLRYGARGSSRKPSRPAPFAYGILPS